MDCARRGGLSRSPRERAGAGRLVGHSLDRETVLPGVDRKRGLFPSSLQDLDKGPAFDRLASLPQDLLPWNRNRHGRARVRLQSASGWFRSLAVDTGLTVRSWRRIHSDPAGSQARTAGILCRRTANSAARVRPTSGRLRSVSRSQTPRRQRRSTRALRLRRGRRFRDDTRYAPAGGSRSGP